VAVKPRVGFIPLGDYYHPLANIAQALDMLTGRSGGEIPPLAATATNTQIIAAINQIIARLNASTN
jgi:hypothetical protein